MKAVLPIPKFSKLQTPSRFFKVVFCQLTGNVCTWLLTARQEVNANPGGCILGTVVLKDDSSDKNRRQTGGDQVLELRGEIRSNFMKIGQDRQSNDGAERGVGLHPPPLSLRSQGAAVHEGQGRAARHTAKAASFSNSHFRNMSLFLSSRGLAAHSSQL